MTGKGLPPELTDYISRTVDVLADKSYTSIDRERETTRITEIVSQCHAEAMHVGDTEEVVDLDKVIESADMKIHGSVFKYMGGTDGEMKFQRQNYPVAQGKHVVRKQLEE